MPVELDVTFYGDDKGTDELAVSINLTTDDLKIKARFANMAKEMEQNADALLDLLVTEPSPFDGPTGGSDA